MSRAIGWALIVMLLYVAGTHPAVLAELIHDAAGILRGAGNQLSSLAGKL